MTWHDALDRVFELSIGVMGAVAFHGTLMLWSWGSLGLLSDVPPWVWWTIGGWVVAGTLWDKFREGDFKWSDK